MWVKSEYAGALAVLSTWACALLPWSVTFFSRELASGTVSAVWIRFLPGRFLYVFGLGFPAESPYRWVWDVPGFVATRGESLASYVWLAGFGVVAAAVAVSLLYYLDEERVESWRFDPVRLLGGLLVAAGTVLLVATGILWWSQGGVVVPVGVLFQLGLGVVLLRVERT
jgi:uncharacterized protein (TIGR04206 family)